MIQNVQQLRVTLQQMDGGSAHSKSSGKTSSRKIRNCLPRLPTPRWMSFSDCGPSGTTLSTSCNPWGDVDADRAACGALFEELHLIWDNPPPRPPQIHVPIYACPSDPIAMSGRIGAYPSYLFNFGEGEQKDGQNGFVTSDRHLAPADFVDGLSQTAAMSEKLVTTDRFWLTGPLDDARRFWETGAPLRDPDELNAFADACLQNHLPVAGPRGYDEIGLILPSQGYNHVMTPNKPSCWNGPRNQGSEHSTYAARTASSLHPGGVHVLMGDGSNRFVSDSIGRAVWRAIASRNGAEAAGASF